MGVCVSSKDNNPHLNNKSQKKNNGIVNNTNTIQQSHKEEIVKKGSLKDEVQNKIDVDDLF